MGFTFKDTKKTFEVKVLEDGEERVVKSYTLDIGNYDMLKEWTREINGLSSMAEKADKDGDMLDDLKKSLEEIIPFVLGEGAFDDIWELSGGNIFSCVAFVRALGEFIQEQIKEIQKSYVS